MCWCQWGVSEHVCTPQVLPTRLFQCPQMRMEDITLLYHCSGHSASYRNQRFRLHTNLEQSLDQAVPELCLSVGCRVHPYHSWSTHTTPLSPMLPPLPVRHYPKSMCLRTHIWISEHCADSVPRDLHCQAWRYHPHFRLWDWGVKSIQPKPPKTWARGQIEHTVKENRNTTVQGQKRRTKKGRAWDHDLGCPQHELWAWLCAPT